MDEMAHYASLVATGSDGSVRMFRVLWIETRKRDLRSKLVSADQIIWTVRRAIDIRTNEELIRVAPGQFKSATSVIYSFESKTLPGGSWP